MTTTGVVENGRTQSTENDNRVAGTMHQVRAFNVCLIMSASLTSRRETKVNLKSQTTSQLVRVVTHKHALGYKLNSIQYCTATGDWIVWLYKTTVTQSLGSRRLGVGTLKWDDGTMKFIQTSPDRDFVRSTQEGRQ